MANSRWTTADLRTGQNVKSILGRVVREEWTFDQWCTHTNQVYESADYHKLPVYRQEYWRGQLDSIWTILYAHHFAWLYWFDGKVLDRTEGERLYSEFWKQLPKGSGFHAWKDSWKPWTPPECLTDPEEIALFMAGKL